MKKTMWFIIISIIAIIFGYFIGRIIFKQEQSNSYNIEETNTNIKLNSIFELKDEEIETSAVTEKVSVNTEIVEEIYYNKCNHKIEYSLKNNDKYVNMTKEELQKKLPLWEIKEFNKDRVVLYKEENDFCNEHFKVIDEEGFVTIYSIDNNDNIVELIDKTEIATRYLTTQDQENLKNGIIVYSVQNLNKLIEDYE